MPEGLYISTSHNSLFKIFIKEKTPEKEVGVLPEVLFFAGDGTWEGASFVPTLTPLVPQRECRFL